MEGTWYKSRPLCKNALEETTDAIGFLELMQTNNYKSMMILIGQYNDTSVQSWNVHVKETDNVLDLVMECKNLGDFILKKHETIYLDRDDIGFSK